MNARDQRRPTKVSLKNSLRVILASIGSDMKYELTTSDLSSQGFFCDFDDPKRFPFLDSSIIEIWLELSPDRTIFFNGKISGIFYGDEKTPEGDTSKPGISIDIIQITNGEQEILNNFISETAEGQVRSDDKDIAS